VCPSSSNYKLSPDQTSDSPMARTKYTDRKSAAQKQPGIRPAVEEMTLFRMRMEYCFKRHLARVHSKKINESDTDAMHREKYRDKKKDRKSRVGSESVPSADSELIDVEPDTPQHDRKEASVLSDRVAAFWMPCRD